MAGTWHDCGRPTHLNKALKGKWPRLSTIDMSVKMENCLLSPHRSTHEQHLRKFTSAGFYTHVLLPSAIFWLLFSVLKKHFARSKTTQLNGPDNPSILFGLYRRINESQDPSALYEEWALKYGPAFRIPGGFGSSRIVICDPRANAHFYSKETFGYVQNKISRIFIEILVSILSILNKRSKALT